MDFEQRFSIHSAGQGFCYSCHIQYQKADEFRFVFDCGTNNKLALTREIQQLRLNGLTAHGRLDLLIISHFDADHVNMIQELLKNDIQVKKLVMPFLLFQERLFLVFKQYLGRKRISETEINTFRIMLDPVGTLSDNLGGDSGIFLVTGDDLPIPGGPGRNIIDRDDEVRQAYLRDDFSSFNDTSTSGFSFIGSRRPDLNEAAQFLLQTTRSNLHVVTDSNKASLILSGEKLMEFLFYKKNIGPYDEQFYEAVEQLFYKREHLSPSDPDFINKLIAVLKKNYRSAAPVRRLFKEAAKIVGMRPSLVADLNTTALCMLHRNVPDLPARIIQGEPSYQYFKAETFSSHHFKNYLKTLTVWPIYYSLNTGFPNVLLTSDAFLKSANDLNAFLEKYRNYLDNLWLVQIPHHGSDKSSDHVFFNTLSPQCVFFVNYGLNNRHGHPALNVIQNAQQQGWLGPYLVNEYQGLQFVYGINHKPLS